MKNLDMNKHYYKVIAFILVLFYVSINGFSQVHAITDTGEEVILYDNGRWE
jgi:hypothetical protein